MNTQFYVVGAGSFAEKLANVFNEHKVCVGIVDEIREQRLANLPIIRSEALNCKDVSLAFFFIAISVDEYAKNAIKRVQHCGVSKGQIVLLKYDSDVLMIEQMLKTSLERLNATLLELKQRDSIVEFAQLDEQFYRKRTLELAQLNNTSKTSIAFCCVGRGGGYYQHVGELPSILNRENECVVLSDTLASQSHFSRTPNLPWYLMGQSCMLQQKHFDLVISAHVFPCTDKSVKRLSFTHMMHDLLIFSQQMISYLEHSETHYLCVPTKASMQMHKELCLQYNIRNNVVLIPGGYPRHDSNLARYQQLPPKAQNAGETCILYAPTLSSLQAGNEIDACFSIIQAQHAIPKLVNAHPRLQLIFRPHPEDLALRSVTSDHPRANAVKELLTFCENHPRCSVDEAKSDYLESFAKSDVLLTDTSSLGMSYAAVTQKPVLFLSDNHERLRQHYEKVVFIQQREQIGYLVDEQNLSTTLESLGIFGEQTSLHSSEKSDYCRSLVFNAGNSQTYIQENLDYILHNKRHPDWWYLTDHI